ncbi:unnamed protein product [Trifolium pratense]|uniref:Uncharacterized protein n=1 Tax=Trifolium pratense TaxID=57577 RepID=A0ACB0KCK5_TRIPR|nr:unnamed protein product [Trifolium pratense]
MFQLLNFADTFASGSPTEWRFSKMLKIFKHLRDITPKLQSLFPDSTLLNKAIAVQNRLGEASRDLFMEMNKFIFIVPEAMQVATPYGQHQQMTVNVVNYMTSVCKSRWKLEQILQEYPKVDNKVETSFIFVKQIEQIIEMLQKKLIAKSKNYKDPALRHIFMLNNRVHIKAENEDKCKVQSAWFVYNNKLRKHIIITH